MSTRNHSSQSKRKSPRYSIIDSSAVMLPLINVISYHVLNISKSGVSFCYDGNSKTSKESNMDMTFFLDTARTIEIPVQIIYDTDLNIKDLSDQPETVDFQKPYLRRCGVEFDQLHQIKKKRLIFISRTSKRQLI